MTPSEADARRLMNEAAAKWVRPAAPKVQQSPWVRRALAAELPVRDKTIHSILKGWNI